MNRRLWDGAWHLSLDAPAKLVLLALCHCVPTNGYTCCVQISQLMQMTALSERGCRLQLGKLRDAGIIECQYQTGAPTTFTLIAGRIWPGLDDQEADADE